MQHDNPSFKNHRDLKLVVLIFALATIGFHMALALRGREISRDQHLGTAVLYAQKGIDLLNPVIPGMNATGTPTPMEFPLWQAITALFMKVFGVWYGWGVVVSLLFMASTLWPLFQLASNLFSPRVAWWTLVLFLVQPLVFQYSGTAGVDGMTASLSIWFLFLCWRMLTEGSLGWWISAALVGGLSSTTKAPFFFVAGLTAFFWLLVLRRNSPRAWIQLVSVGVVSIVAFMLWNHHANKWYARAEMPGSALLTDSKLMMKWWLGDFSSRLKLRPWITGGWRAANSLLGGFALVGLPLVGWFLGGTRLLRLWMAAGVAAVMVFTAVILMHSHYYFIFSAPVALLCARAIAEFEPGLWKRFSWPTFARASFYVLILTANLVQGLYSSRLNLRLDPYNANCARVIREHTAPTDKIAVWGMSWGEPFLRAEREGVTIETLDPIADPRKLARLKELGYNRLVLLNPSPLLVAITRATGSGGSDTKDLPNELPLNARSWPVIFKSPDLLIVEIPQ